MPAWIYILKLRSNGLYIGCTRNRERRCKEHFSRTGCRTTIIDPPIAVVYEEEFNTYREASIHERQIKRWSRAKKEALIRGDMKTLHHLARRRH